jgi:hypothetical protein
MYVFLLNNLSLVINSSVEYENVVKRKQASMKKRRVCLEEMVGCLVGFLSEMHNDVFGIYIYLAGNILLTEATIYCPSCHLLVYV